MAAVKAPKFCKGFQLKWPKTPRCRKISVEIGWIVRDRYVSKNVLGTWDWYIYLHLADLHGKLVGILVPWIELVGKYGKYISSWFSEMKCWYPWDGTKWSTPHTPSFSRGIYWGPYPLSDGFSADFLADGSHKVDFQSTVGVWTMKKTACLGV